MLNFLNRPQSSPEETDIRSLTEKVSANQEKCDVYLRSITVMLHFLKAFALDVQEIQSDRFKQEIEELNERFQAAEKPKRQELHFEQRKEHILNFIDRQHAYIKDREKELRDIIDLLSRAMSNLNVENREFYQRINHQGEKIIKISALDDIKKIKNALKVEVDQMRDIVALKEDQEHRQIRLLAGQVNTLQTELEKAREKAVTDALTGVYNRQALDDFIAERVDRGHMSDAEFSLLMIDIDNFKQINDKFGHPIGDRVLVALAQKCRTSIRGGDFLARYGGEEFTILLEGAGFRNALKKAQQLCQTIAALRYATNDNATDEYLSMTISIGVSQFKKGDTVTDLIGRADKALYDAKHKGKNCVVGRKS
ncbi:MAG: diguanylate cyclase [Desulfobacterales bacterium]|nr:diguanylate cyclase [Desulfobacterales bacterium]